MSMPVSRELSAEGIRLKKLCDAVAESVAVSTRSLVGDPASGDVLEMGADGTPTKMIDRMAEDAALAVLEESGLGFAVLSEELGKTTIGDEPRYFLHLDPLDGTFNAVKGIPFYSISMYIDGQDCRFGYVFDLAHKIGFYAQAGCGAWTEPSHRIRVSEARSLADFSVAAYTLRPHTARIIRLGDTVRRIRTLGSSALELCLVASGKLDAFADLRGGLRMVDVAAGSLIVEEAGGVVTDGDGKRILFNGDMWQRKMFLASNGPAHRKLLDLMGGGNL